VAGQARAQALNPLQAGFPALGNASSTTDSHAVVVWGGVQAQISKQRSRVRGRVHSGNQQCSDMSPVAAFVAAERPRCADRSRAGGPLLEPFVLRSGRVPILGVFPVRFLEHPRNQGHGAALVDGPPPYPGWKVGVWGARERSRRWWSGKWGLCRQEPAGMGD